jgi:hypothetical protein
LLRPRRIRRGEPFLRPRRIKDGLAQMLRGVFDRVDHAGDDERELDLVGGRLNAVEIARYQVAQAIFAAPPTASIVIGSTCGPGTRPFVRIDIR